MTLATEHEHVPETASPTPSGPSTSPLRLGVIVGWVCVIVALVAAGLLAFSVVVPDRSPSRIDTGRTVAEHGSVRAIEHRDERAMNRLTASQTIAEHGTVRAIEHRDEPTVNRATPSQTIAEHGSVRAIEHRDDEASTR